MKTLKYAVRFLMRAKSYTLINLLGLAFSLACCIILVRYIHRELTVDSHCVDRERVIVSLRNLNNITSFSSTAYCDTAYIPESKIVGRANIIMFGEEPIQYNEQDYSLLMIKGNNDFLQLFRFEALEGSLDLSAPDCAILSQACAQRIFGKESPIGKVLLYNERKSVTVRGVIKQPVCKTTLDFDILLFNEEDGNSVEFFQVLPSVDLEAVNKVSNVLRRFKLPNGNYSPLQHSFKFVSLKDLYFNKPNNVSLAYLPFLNFGSSNYLGILFIVAVLLLFVGILNFVNLYMVYMMKRQKEYGIKKVYGLQKLPLFLQIWVENVILAFCALMVAWLLIEITQVPVARLMGAEMKYTVFDLQLSLGFLLILPLFTSVYPYIRYQYMSPITSMRSIATNRQSVVTRMLLLTVQYVITFVLVVFSLYLNKHFQFLLNTSPGFRTERILNTDLVLEKTTYRVGDDFEKFKAKIDKVEVLKQKLNECPDIEVWSEDNIFEYQSSQPTVYNEKGEAFDLRIRHISPSFFKVYNIKVAEGVIPDSLHIMDSHILLNRSAMKLMGFTQLEHSFIRSDFLKRVMVINGSIRESGNSLIPVSAVIEDYYSGHLTEGIKPMAYMLDPIGGVGSDIYSICIREGKEQAVLNYLRSIVKEIYGTEEFEYKWMKDCIAEIYEEDRQVATIYTVFALIAIAVSCLGLFGISLFDIRQRYREIGIRKVNGASMKDLYKLLFRKYVTVLVIAFVIAIPLAYYAVHTYTQGFVVKAPIGVDVFLVALLLVALISMGTLFWQIRKAANINPSEVMKSE